MTSSWTDPPWMTQNLKHMINKKHCMFNKAEHSYKGSDSTKFFIDWVELYPVSMRVVIWIVHVKDTGKAVCCMSSQSPTEKVISRHGHTRHHFKLLGSTSLRKGPRNSNAELTSTISMIFSTLAWKALPLSPSGYISTSIAKRVLVYLPLSLMERSVQTVGIKEKFWTSTSSQFSPQHLSLPPTPARPRVPI